MQLELWIIPLCCYEKNLAASVAWTNTSSKQWRQGFGRCYPECKWVEIQLRPKLECNKMVALALASAAERLQCTRVSFQLEIPEEFCSVVFRTFYKRCCLIKIDTQVILNSTYQMQYYWSPCCLGYIINERYFTFLDLKGKWEVSENRVPSPLEFVTLPIEDHTHWATWVCKIPILLCPSYK